jgi:hypothetical protein
VLPVSPVSSSRCSTATESKRKDLATFAMRTLYRYMHYKSTAKSASYATSLRSLEEKELIKTYKNKGKSVRISHLELTMVGAIISVKLRYN